ncbi:MAG: hypothetical protein E7368_01185 [Clostridiales bacterium]|nr:hypothetical protein [Clostridiales bacterium]
MSKKVVFIVILIECVLAVFLISFLGQAIYNSVNKVYVTEIYFTYKDGTKIEDDVPLKLELTDENRSYTLDWVVGPENATNQEVYFSGNVDESLVRVDPETGKVTFRKLVDVVITVMSMDGSNVSDTIHLIPVIKDGGDVDI